MREKKPPLGLKPRRIALLQRKTEILETMDRYIEENEPIPIEWLEELNEIMEKLKSL